MYCKDFEVDKPGIVFSFLVTVFYILRALCAYLSVLRVSSKETKAGLMQAIIYVWVLPPRESFNNLVNLESLYGTNAPFFVVSARMFMQLPNARRDLLMFAPSYSLSPLFSVTAALSEPAKSTKHNLLNTIDYWFLFVFFIELSYSILFGSLVSALGVIVYSM